MTAIILHRINAARDMRQFYRLDVQRDLFGARGVIREWGRVCRSGWTQQRRAAKQARGYVPVQV